MPYLTIETNKKIKENQKNKILYEATDLISNILNKPKKWVMISIKDNISMCFGNTGEDTAYIELKSIKLDKEKCKFFLERLSNFIEENLNIKPERIYIHFIDLDPKMFGWNKKLFT